MLHFAWRQVVNIHTYSRQVVNVYTYLRVVEIEEESKNSYDIILFYVKVSGVSTHILLKIIYFTI